MSTTQLRSLINYKLNLCCEQYKPKMFGCQPKNYNYPRRRKRKRFSYKPNYYRNPIF